MAVTRELVRELEELSPSEVREIWLEVSQQPWETIPRVFLEEEGK